MKNYIAVCPLLNNFVVPLCLIRERRLSIQYKKKKEKCQLHFSRLETPRDSYNEKSQETRTDFPDAHVGEFENASENKYIRAHHTAASVFSALFNTIELRTVRDIVFIHCIYESYLRSMNTRVRRARIFSMLK